MTRTLAVLASGLGTGAVSAALGSRALFALAIGLVLLAAAAWATIALAVHWLSAERSLSVREAQEHHPLRVRVSVAHGGWLPVRIEIEDHAGGWLAVTDGQASLELSIARRGEYRLAPTRMRLRDLTGMFERHMLVGRAEPLLILPSPRDGPPARPRHSRFVDDPDPEGLAPYVPGTPLTRIHWPALARGAGLHVRRFAPPPDELPLVVVDTAGAATGAALDWTARTAAGSVLTLARAGGCRVLLPGDARATSVFGCGATWRAVHRRLATLGDRPAPVTPTSQPSTATIHVRAAAAPPELGPAPPLPRGISAVSRCQSDW